MWRKVLNCHSEQDSAIEALAIAAAKAVDIDYCGVDIMRDKARSVMGA